MNIYDKHTTIKIFQCGIASGAYGPWLFLVKSYNIDLDTFKGCFSRKHGAPTGLQLIVTTNTYMTDKVCNEISKYFAAGIWELPIVRGYPYLWMVLNLFGFVFHLQGEALKVFAYYKIFTVKEEGDTSQACQAYYKDIAK